MFKYKFYALFVVFLVLLCVTLVLSTFNDVDNTSFSRFSFDNWLYFVRDPSDEKSGLWMVKNDGSGLAPILQSNMITDFIVYNEYLFIIDSGQLLVYTPEGRYIDTVVAKGNYEIGGENYDISGTGNRMYISQNTIFLPVKNRSSSGESDYILTINTGDWAEKHIFSLQEELPKTFCVIENSICYLKNNSIKLFNLTTNEFKTVYEGYGSNMFQMVEFMDVFLVMLAEDPAKTLEPTLSVMLLNRNFTEIMKMEKTSIYSVCDRGYVLLSTQGSILQTFDFENFFEIAEGIEGRISIFNFPSKNHLLARIHNTNKPDVIEYAIYTYASESYFVFETVELQSHPSIIFDEVYW